MGEVRKKRKKDRKREREREKERKTDREKKKLEEKKSWFLGHDGQVDRALADSLKGNRATNILTCSKTFGQCMLSELLNCKKWSIMWAERLVRRCRERKI